jgi:DNA-binding XRE family transcriptional regulator
MSVQTITRGGKKFVLLEQSEYDRLRKLEYLPALPAPLVGGLRPAVPFARSMIAREIIQERQSIGWSQAELSRQSGIQVATLNRIEKARVTPDETTIARIDRALKRGAKRVNRRV